MMMMMPRFRTKIPKLKACNPLNQPALDHLYELSQSNRFSNSKNNHQQTQQQYHQKNQHYPRLFVKAMQSLSKCPLYISNFKDATSLSGIGNFLGREIMNAVNKDQEERRRNRSGGGDGDDGDDDNDESIVELEAGLGCKETRSGRGQPSKSSSTSTRKSKTNGTTKQKTSNDQESIRESLSSTLNHHTKTKPTTSTTSTTTTTTTNTSTSTGSISKPTSKKPSAPTISNKERAHIQSTNESIGILTNIHLYQNWKIILLLDIRERYANAVQSKLLQYGIDCEQRQLPIADILWIARGEYHPHPQTSILPNTTKTTASSHHHHQQPQPQMIIPESIEIVLGTLIERKSLSDLVSSIYGTRFEEQRLRLKHSHSAMDCENQVIFLVEGTHYNDVPNCPASSLKYAIMTTRIHMGFQIICTKNLEDTCRMLKRIHCKMIARTFPEEIQQRRRMQFHNVFSSSCSSSSFEKQKKKRRKHRSSMDFRDEFVDPFQSIPKIPFERKRHYLYNELKTKIELDRERGTKSIHAIYRAQLKQVRSMSIKKVEAISRIYRTPRALMEGYEHLHNEKECEAMVEDIPLRIKVERVSRVGPKSSAELSHVYTKGGTVTRWVKENCTKDTNIKPSFSFDHEVPKLESIQKSNDTQSNYSVYDINDDNTPKRGNIHILEGNRNSSITNEASMVPKNFDGIDPSESVDPLRSKCSINIIDEMKKSAQPESFDLTQSSNDSNLENEDSVEKGTKKFIEIIELE